MSSGGSVRVDLSIQGLGYAGSLQSRISPINTTQKESLSVTPNESRTLACFKLQKKSLLVVLLPCVLGLHGLLQRSIWRLQSEARIQFRV